LFAQWVIYLYWKKKFAGSGGVKGGSHEYILHPGTLLLNVLKEDLSLGECTCFECFSFTKLEAEWSA
jgi:hypothetical protein